MSNAPTAPTNRPGMDSTTGRCGTCDGPYCGTTCHAREGYVWVNGRGWMSPDRARVLERVKRLRVQWHEAWSEADNWVRPTI